MEQAAANRKPSLAIVIPCYNEQAVLPEIISKMEKKILALQADNLISDTSVVYLVDDGSRDRTWEIIESKARETKQFKGIKLSRNYGHQNALLAGLFNTREDIVISMDADLQDDINVIKEMIIHHCNGAQIVYGVRSERKKDAVFKRMSAVLFYKLLARLGIDIVFNHADFRLMSRRSIEELKAFNEVNLLLRGIVPLIGFEYKTVNYKRNERFAGKSKYSLYKMLSLAWNGILSFSNYPLRLISVSGFMVFLLSFGMSLWVLFIKLFTGSAVPGWASSVLPVFFLGGVQILSIGVIGEYLAKIYMEVKKRPRFIIEKTIDRE